MAPQEIADPSDNKPSDWVDDAEIADPSDVKPADWDDREEVEDEEAEKPEGWLDDGPEYIDDPSEFAVYLLLMSMVFGAHLPSR